MYFLSIGLFDYQFILNFTKKLLFFCMFLSMDLVRQKLRFSEPFKKLIGVFSSFDRHHEILWYDNLFHSIIFNRAI